MSNRPFSVPSLRRFRLFFLAFLAVAIAQLPSRGEVIILKDGYTIHGKMGTEKTVIHDPLTGEPIVTEKMKGLNTLDDGPRWTVFSANYKRIGDVNEMNKFADQVTFTRKTWGRTSYQLANAMTYVSTTEYNGFWIRTLTYRDTLNQSLPPYKIEQQIDVLTPHYARVISNTHRWTSHYLTKELGSELVRRLLSTHPDLIENKSGPDVGKRAKLIKFLIQADWLNEAEEEVERLIKDIPAETKRAEEFRTEIREARTDKMLAELERAKESGRHGVAQGLLKRLPKDVPAKLALKIAGFKAEYDAATAKLEKAKRFINDLKEITPSSFKDLVLAADIVVDELHLDTAARLDLFIALAEQADLSRKAKQPPLHKSEELLAAAISAWLMGNNSTETNVATARKRLRAREIALNYLREPASQKRREILLNLQLDTQALPFDELEKLISLLPPPEALKEISYLPVEMKTGAIPGLIGGVNYFLHLPPEYQHGRAYPLLIVLPGGGERPNEALKRFGDLPGRNGYIVAVLDWTAAFKATYAYTEEEQLMATGLLRHLRRTLQVDSDRVFLFGNGEGANFALDMGATQPDLFAGIVPMTPSPEAQLFKTFEYWKNFQNLPVYMVIGDRAGAAVKTIRDILTEWMPRGYPALAVSYKGRGMEWFGEELPLIFDWMGRKTRATGLPDLGRIPNEEFRTVRASSNHFYWIGMEELSQNSLYDPQKGVRNVFPAKIAASLSEGNLITVRTAMGMSQLNIFLGKGTVDFAKPVRVNISGRVSGAWSGQLTPKITVLLEDLYERGDRQRPFYQKINVSNLNRVVKFAAE